MPTATRFDDRRRAKYVRRRQYAQVMADVPDTPLRISRRVSIPQLRIGHRVRYRRVIGTRVIEGESRISKVCYISGWWYELERFGKDMAFRPDELACLEVVPVQIATPEPLPFEDAGEWIPPTFYLTLDELYQEAA